MRGRVDLRAIADCPVDVHEHKAREIVVQPVKQFGTEIFGNTAVYAAALAFCIL